MKFLTKLFFQLGALAVVLGLFSFLINLVGFEFKILQGSSTMDKITCVLVGIALIGLAFLIELLSQRKRR